MNNKHLCLDDIIGVMTEKLDTGGKVSFTPRGRSMLPMLRDCKDTIILEKPKGKLKLHDVALYKRDNGKYVLHRVYALEKNGCYSMCGDNQYGLERGIRDDQIIAVMTSFSRKGKNYDLKSVSYKVYVFTWHYLRYIKRLAYGTIHKIKSIFNSR